MFFLKKNIAFKELVPPNFIDIHSHLLPGIDDGVKTVYESAYIIEQLHKNGVSGSIVTPHVLQDVWPNTTSTIEEKLDEMREVLNTLNIVFPLFASAEYMLDELFEKRLNAKDILPLFNHYLLVEMSTFSAPLNLNELLFNIKVSGFKPILAHPERYSFYHDKFNKYEKLKEDGFQFQLNILALKGHYGDHTKETAIKLLNNGFYDFIGTDIHHRQHLEIIESGIPKRHAQRTADLMKNNCIFEELIQSEKVLA